MSHHDDWNYERDEAESEDAWRILGTCGLVFLVLLMAGLAGGPLAVLLVMLALMGLVMVL